MSRFGPAEHRSDDPPPPDAETPAKAPLPTADVSRVIEAMLFVGGRPVTAEVVAASFPEIGSERFLRVVRTLARRCIDQRRPYRIVAGADGYRMELAGPVRNELQNRLYPERAFKLSRVQLETLAVIAYRQPIDRAAVERLTGRECGATLRQLRRRGLVTGVRTADDAADRYTVTPRCLDILGVESAEDLPRPDDLET